MDEPDRKPVETKHRIFMVVLLCVMAANLVISLMAYSAKPEPRYAFNILNACGWVLTVSLILRRFRTVPDLNLASKDWVTLPILAAFAFAEGSGAARDILEAIDGAPEKQILNVITGIAHTTIAFMACVGIWNGCRRSRSC